MSTSFGRRLIFAAIGVASFTAAVIFMIAERRRRKDHLRGSARGLNGTTISSMMTTESQRGRELSVDKPEEKPEETPDPPAQIEQNAQPIPTTEKDRHEVASISVADTKAEREDAKEMVSAENQSAPIPEPTAQTINTNTVTKANSIVECKNMNGTTKKLSNGTAKDPELHVNFKQQNGLHSLDSRTSAKSKTENSKFPPQKSNAKTSGRKDSTLTPLMAESGEYQNAESPSGTSTNSDGSADSGRATGGPNCSPFDGHGGDMDMKPVYEFEVPNTLVGLIIGIHGKTISELCHRATVRMLIRPHHTASRFDTHQICSIEGPRKNINKCLHMIRYRFPIDRFPDLNLKPVLPPTMLECTGQMIGNEPSTLSLPISVPCEAFISNVVDPGHFFVQLPTHPTFSSLTNLDYYSMSIYSQLSGIPVLPKPCGAGVVCIAPTPNGWFRAITLDYNEAEDTAIVRLADYGGFLQLPRSELRQIRSDLTTLPMQAIECYLAHVQPIDGTSRWSEEAMAMFTKLCAIRIVQAELVGYNRENNIPYVEIYATDENKKVCRVDKVLLERGHAKPSDPAKVVPVQPVGKPNRK